MHFLVVCVLVALFVLLFETPWAVFHQALLSVKYSMQEYWSKWVAMPVSRGFSQPRDRAQFSHIEGRFFTVLYMRQYKNRKWVYLAKYCSYIL